MSRRGKYKARVRCPRRIVYSERASDWMRGASLVAATKLRTVAQPKFSIINEAVLALQEAAPRQIEAGPPQGRKETQSDSLLAGTSV